MAKTTEQIFNLSDAVKYSNQDVSGGDRTQRMHAELDNAIKKAVMSGEFNLDNGSIAIFMNSDSILSTMTESELNVYLRARDWKIDLKKSVTFVVKVPTYQYIINFGENFGNKQISFIFEDEKLACGVTTGDGRIAVDLSTILLLKNTHPHYVDIFKFAATDGKSDTLFTIDKVDTNYDYLETQARLFNNNQQA